MRQANGTRRNSDEKIVKDIKRATRKHFHLKRRAGGAVGWRCLIELELHWAWSWWERRGEGGFFVR